MRKIKIVTLVLLCIVTAGLCGLLAYGMSGHDIYMMRFDSDYMYRSGGSMHLVLEDEIPLDGIDSISILYDMNSNDIHIYESEGNLLTVKEYNERELTEDEISTIQTAGSSLEIKGKKRNDYTGFRFFSFGPVGGYVEIGLPSSYAGALELATASGDIRSQMELVLDKDLKAGTSSGDVSMPDVEAANISVSCSSGNVRLETVTTDKSHAGGEAQGVIKIKTSSGNIIAVQLTGRNSIESSSGDITVKQLTGDTTIESSSGTVRSDRITGDTQIATTSGDITIQCIDGSAKAEASSGNVRIYAGSGMRTVNTTSGDILLDGVDGAWNVEVSSGTVQIKASKGSGAIRSTSGDITLELGELTGNLEMNSSSGSARIKLSKDNAFDFAAKTSSGDIDTFFDEDLNFSKKGNSAQGTYGGGENGKYIHIGTTSGDVRVTKN